MKIRVLGGGLYGCHITKELKNDNYDVELHEISDKLFSGASGNIPARLHTGAHYPRSSLTREACKKHYDDFMRYYGDFSRHVPLNIYAIAEYDSLLDFGTYKKILRKEVPFLEVKNTREYGLRNVDGAIIIDERHIIVDELRDYFANELNDVVRYNFEPEKDSLDDWDLTIDATFCARENERIDRYELCLTVLLKGPSDRAVTIMDGPFPSLYPWDEKKNICSLTSALHTPIAKCKTWREAKNRMIFPVVIEEKTEEMLEQIKYFYPEAKDFEVVDHRIAIRALPRSGADARLIDVVEINPRLIRIRAGKMDAIFDAYETIYELIKDKEIIGIAA